MCGKVISNDFDPKQPWFTENGSFWTNSTTKLFESNKDNNDLGETRMCHQSGYESVALIPLKSSGRTLGLIQLNDPRKNKFSLKMITNYEHIADLIGGVISDTFEISEKMKEISELIKKFESAKN